MAGFITNFVINTSSARVYALATGSTARCDMFGLSPELVKRELPIIQAGPNHKNWLSARLLLGLTEAEAQEVHKAWAQ